MTLNLDGIERIVIATHPEAQVEEAFFVSGYATDQTVLEEVYTGIAHKGNYFIRQLKEATEHKIKEYVRSK